MNKVNRIMTFAIFYVLAFLGLRLVYEYINPWAGVVAALLIFWAIVRLINELIKNKNEKK